MRPGGVTSSVGPRWHSGGHLADCNLRSAAPPWRDFVGRGLTHEAKGSEVVLPVDPCPGCALRPTFRGTTHSRSRLRPTGDAYADSPARADKAVPPMFPGLNAVTSKPMPNKPDLSNDCKSGLRPTPSTRPSRRPALQSRTTEAGPPLAERQLP